MAFFEKICQCHLHHGMLANYHGKVGDMSADGSVFRLWLNFEDNPLGQKFEVKLHFGVIRKRCG